MFTITSIQLESVTCIIPDGRLDTINNSLFQEELQSLIEKEDFLIIDFARCNYLASTGIRSLIATAKTLGAKGGGLMLAGLSTEVYQVLEMAGLNKVFHIFKDADIARAEIMRLRATSKKRSEVRVGKKSYHVDHSAIPSQPVLTWNQKTLAGYNELYFALGTGSPAESLTEDEENLGLFITAGSCSGFIPFNRQLSPEFRVLQDPSAGGIFLHRALSFGCEPGSRVTLANPSPITLAQLTADLSDFPADPGKEKLRAILTADFNGQESTVSLLSFQEPGETGSEPWAKPSSSTSWQDEKGNSIAGISFLLDELPEPGEEESALDFTRRVLTIQNIESVVIADSSNLITRPVIWLFYSGELQEASARRLQVESQGEFVPEPYKEFLTRRLFDDSARVVVKQLHGGYSAQTFQVESYDHHGRKMRPTVLKIANRNLISREAERCQRYSLPYIMNNSAMVLGTAFFGNMGALRYNFVGIGGEQTQLKWLTHYFNNWSAEELEPLYDKIFLHILKPWYGQPVKELIFPYRDHDPTFTFFTTLCETASELFSLSVDEKYMLIEETGQKRINPYWFLKHQYALRRDESLEYYTSICHGDLNMQNILLDKEMNVYLIDFSETRPRSVVSDFARLEAIFMIEHAPLESREDLEEMIRFTTKFYSHSYLDEFPEIHWHGKAVEKMKRNLTLSLKMRKYAVECTKGKRTIVPYYVALLEWILPVVCYGGVSLPHKKLSAYVAGLLCEKIMECDDESYLK